MKNIVYNVHVYGGFLSNIHNLMAGCSLFPTCGRRDAVTAAKLRAEGVVAGVADLILLKSNRDYGALLIEMKTTKGRQSESQKKWQKTVCFNEEYKYVVCRSFDDFKREVDEYLRNK